MSRLFDAGAKEQREKVWRLSREEVRGRADAVNRALEEASLLDDADRKLMSRLESVRPVVYEAFRLPGSKWKLEHARAGADYVFQMFPLKPPALVWQDVVLLIITAMDAIFPRTAKINYRPPNDEFQIKFYTITVQDIVGKPGWERACRERALHSLASLDVWSL